MALSPDGGIYYVYSLDGTRMFFGKIKQSDGTKYWTDSVLLPNAYPCYQSLFPTLVRMAVYSDSNIFIANPGGKVYALDSSGNILWVMNTAVNFGLALSHDGTLYV